MLRVTVSFELTLYLIFGVMATIPVCAPESFARTWNRCRCISTWLGLDGSPIIAAAHVH